MKECFLKSCEDFKDKLSIEQKNESFAILQYYLDMMRDQKKKGKLPDVTEAERSFYIVINDKVLLRKKGKKR